MKFETRTIHGIKEGKKERLWGTSVDFASTFPDKNFVALWITISIPKSKGLCKYGVIKVLSAIVIKLCSFAIFTTPLISVTSNNGFEGVSIKIAFVLGFIAFLIFSKSVVSTNVDSTPNFE